MATLAVGSFILALVGKSIPSFDFVDWVYLLFGFVFAPIEYLMCGAVGQLLTDAYSMIIFIVSTVVFVLSIVLMVYKLKSSNEEEYRKKYFKKISYVLLILSLIMFIFNLSVLLINFNNINNYLISVVEMFYKLAVGNILIIIYITIIIFGILVLLFSLISTIFYKKETTKTVKIYGTINFYSKEFEEPQNDISVKKQEEEGFVESLGIKESTEEAKDLVNKIMQLEELRESGQISNVEYTKLRQKAIKRYKR